MDEVDLSDKRPVEMKPATMRALLKAYNDWMDTKVFDPLGEDRTSYRNLLLRQVRRFNAWIMEESPEYMPFPWEQIR